MGLSFEKWFKMHSPAICFFQTDNFVWDKNFGLRKIGRVVIQMVIKLPTQTMPDSDLVGDFHPPEKI